MGGKASKAELENAVPGRIKSNYEGPPFVWVGDSKEQTVPARANDTLVSAQLASPASPAHTHTSAMHPSFDGQPVVHE